MKDFRIVSNRAYFYLRISIWGCFYAYVAVCGNVNDFHAINDYLALIIEAKCFENFSAPDLFKCSKSA